MMKSVKNEWHHLEYGPCVLCGSEHCTAVFLAKSICDECLEDVKTSNY